MNKKETPIVKYCSNCKKHTFHKRTRISSKSKQETCICMHCDKTTINKRRT